MLGHMFVGPTPSQATTYLVAPDGSGDFPSIQAAIDASVDGETVQLTDGVFLGDANRRLRFYGKEITLESASGNPDACILDGEYAAATAISLIDGEGEGCVIRGISIRKYGYGSGIGGGIEILNGSKPLIVNCNVTQIDAIFGVGFEVRDASPRFSGCVFAGNVAQEHAAGGEVWGNCTVDFERCHFFGNRAGISGFGNGGALDVGNGAQVTLSNCTLSDNRVGLNSDPVFAGGIFVGGGPNGGASVTLKNSILRGNCNIEAMVFGGGSLSFECCIVDSSAVTNYQNTGTVTYQGENWFTDPLFCDPGPCNLLDPTILGDYTVDAASPALLASCGPIGAFGQGCTTVSIDPLSWGRIKGVYRLGNPSKR